MRNHKINMKKALMFFALALLFATLSCAERTARQYENLKYPALGKVEIPEIERVTLSNGMRLFLLEDHELPLINAFALIRTGSVYEPADKTGLAAITGTVMRTGGTTSMTGDQIDEELEQIAASVSTGISLNTGSASMSVLKEDVDTALKILADVLMNPAFGEDKIELAKIQARTSIARRNDNMQSIASREYLKLIYGPQSVYARHTEYATINNITRDDLVSFHRKYYHPNNMMLALWGDFDSKEMKDKIEKVFGNWEKGDVEPGGVPQPQYEFTPTVNLVSKEDINQSSIFLGHIGGLMNDPDYFALVVMNEILGSSFTSRLFKNVRSRMGLAYSVGGEYGSDYDHPGVFYIACQTKSESTVRAIKAMANEVKKITESQVTDEELTLAKEAYLNSFVFNFESRAQIIRRLMMFEYFGYPEDFLQQTRENVENVTAADVLRVARAHLRPDEMQILVVGRPQDFDEPLSDLGAVKNIDITIPAP
jgi:zinc protease